MKRYQKLIIDAAEEIGFNKLSRVLGVPSTSVHEWATMPHKTPHYKSLVKIAEYFKIPVACTIMETGPDRSVDEDIIELLYTLTHEQKEKLLQQIRQL
jgi:hypothetical protein